MTAEEGDVEGPLVGGIAASDEGVAEGLGVGTPLGVGLDGLSDGVELAETTLVG